MKIKMFKGGKRRAVFTTVTVVLLLLLLTLNFLLTYFGGEKTLFWDTTYEGLYTVTDKMKKECDGIFDSLEDSGDEKVKITFCTDPDYLMQSSTTRASYILAKKLSNMYPDKVELVTVNALLNPTAVAEYKSTSLTEINASDIIVSYGGRYRITAATRFWVTGSDSTYFNGEYRFASLIRSVTAVDSPRVYFVTGHGESYYDTENPDSDMSAELYEFYTLLEGRGLTVKTLDLSEVSRIPEDCVLLVINNPTSDFTYDPDRLDEFSYVSDIEKIDRYLVMHQGAVMVTKDYSVKLPVLEKFLSTWGFSFGEELIKDENASLEDEGNTGTALITKYDTDESSYGYAIYGEYADLSSAPITVIENAGRIECSFTSQSGTVSEQGSQDTDRTYVPFLTTKDTAKLYSKNDATGEYTDLAGDEGIYDLASLTVRSQIDPETAEHIYSYVFATNSPDFLSGKYLSGSSSYANYDIVSGLVENITRIDEHASIDLGGTSLNSSSGGGKKMITTEMNESAKTVYSNKYVNDDKSNGLIVIKELSGISEVDKTFITILAFSAPLALGILGITVCIKRRFL